MLVIIAQVLLGLIVLLGATIWFLAVVKLVLREYFQQKLAHMRALIMLEK